MEDYEIYEHIHNARTLLGLLLPYVEDDEYEDIRFAVETAFFEAADAEEGIKHKKHP